MLLHASYIYSRGLPSPYLRHTFKTLHRPFQKFVWGRINKATMSQPKSMGGAGLSNLSTYHAVTVFTRIFDLFHCTSTIDLWAHPWIHTTLRPHNALLPLLTLDLLQLWDKFNKLHLVLATSPLTPFFDNTAFPPALTSTSLLKWTTSFQNRFVQLLTDGKLPSLSDASPLSPPYYSPVFRIINCFPFFVHLKRALLFPETGPP